MKLTGKALTVGGYRHGVPRHGRGTPMSRLTDMGENRGLLTLARATGWYLRLVGVVEVRAVAAGPGTWEVPCLGSRKARTLLALLGARAGRVVTVDSVVDAVWNGAPPRQPEANVATLVSRLRATFGPEIIAGGRDGYRLGDGVRVDLHDAAALVAMAESCLNRGQPSRALSAAERAIRLLDRGQVLAAHPAADWAEQARATQEALLRRAWYTAAESALGAGVPVHAHVLAESAIAADPLDEAAYRVLMRAFVAMGEPARAMVAYQELRTTLAAELGTDPAAGTRDLYVTILRANAATG